MACIFFPPRSSLLVTVLGAGLFVACVGMETTGLLPSRSIVAGACPSRMTLA